MRGNGSRGPPSEAHGEALALIIDGKRTIEARVDIDAGLRIAPAAGTGTEMEQPISHLYGVVVGDRPPGFEAADRFERRRVGDKLPGGRGIRRTACEAGIVAREKAVHDALRVGKGARAGEAEFRDEAVLKGAKEPFYTTLGLRRLSCYPPNAQFRQRAADLRVIALALELLLQCGLHPRRRAKDAVAIGIDGPGDAIAAQELAEEEQIAVRVLLEPEDGPDDASGRIINGCEEDQAGSAVLQPGMVAAVHLDEEAGLRHPFAPAPMAGRASGAWAAKPGGAEQTLDRPARQLQAFVPHKHFREVMIVETGIGRAREGEHPAAGRFFEAPRRGTTAVPMGKRPETLLTQPSQEPAEVAQREPEELGRRRSVKPPVLHLGKHVYAVLFSLAHDDHLPGHDPRVTDSLAC